MFAREKDLVEQKRRIDELENIINNMSFHLVQLQNDLNELKKPKEPGYLA